MLNYAVKRLGLAVAIVSVAMFLLFCMIYLVPGDPASVAANRPRWAGVSRRALTRIPLIRREAARVTTRRTAGPAWTTSPRSMMSVATRRGGAAVPRSSKAPFQST